MCFLFTWISFFILLSKNLGYVEGWCCCYTANSPRRHTITSRKPIKSCLNRLYNNSDGNNAEKIISSSDTLDGNGEDATPQIIRRAFLASTFAAGTEFLFSQNFVRPGFRRLRPTQFIAALGDPASREGMGAEQWGVWEMDPGPRGIPLNQFSNFVTSEGIGEYKNMAPAGWEVNDFWLEEHGIWMETPTYNIPPGRYLVTGGRMRTSVLTIDPENESGRKRWSLDGGTLHDVTHLPCRSARYVVEEEGKSSPLNARREDFPVTPGAQMPAVEGCQKQDYAVLFVTGIEDV